MPGGGQQGGVGMAGQEAGTGGGLGGPALRFEPAESSHIAQPWVGNGKNQPVSPQQPQSMFGESQVRGLASQAGMQPQGFLSQRSQRLPTSAMA